MIIENNNNYYNYLNNQNYNPKKRKFDDLDDIDSIENDDEISLNKKQCSIIKEESDLCDLISKCSVRKSKRIDPKNIRQIRSKKSPNQEVYRLCQHFLQRENMVTPQTLFLPLWGRKIYAIVESSEYEVYKQLVETINTIDSKRHGKSLLEMIDRGHHLVFVKFKPGDQSCKTFDTPYNIFHAGKSSLIEFNFETGLGCGIKAEPIPNPPFIVLAHELIHAYHASIGINQYQIRQNSHNDYIWSNQEELKTIFTGEINENQIRSEHNLPLRYGHIALDHLKNQETKNTLVRELNYFNFLQEK